MTNPRVRTGLLAFLAFTLPVMLHAQLAQNGTSTLAATWAPGTLTSTFAHTTPNLQNRLLMVAVHMNLQDDGNTTASVASVTYNTVPLTLANAITDGGDDVRTELWVLLAPATGSHNVVVTMTAITGGDTVQGVVGATTFVDVDQALTGSLGYTASGSSNTPSNGGLAGTAAGDLVVDFMTARDNGSLTASVGGGQSSVYNTKSPGPFNGDDALAVSSTETSTGGTVTMSYTLNANRDWAMVGGSLRGARTDVGIMGVATPDVIDVGSNSVTFTYTITAYDVGANAISFADTLPAGLTIVSATPSQGTCTPGATTNCSIGELDAGTSATVTLVATTTGGTPGITYNNTASIAVGTTDAVAANNSVTLSVRTQGQLCANPGKDGVGGTLTGAVNTYYPGTVSAAAGATSITVGAVPAGYGASAITVGDLLLIMQMQDAAIDSSNDELYGDGTGLAGATGSPGSGATNLNNAGRYEYAVAASAITTAGGAITISGVGTGGGLLYAYTNANATGTQGQRRFQVIRVPQHTSATITPSISVPNWNGNVGGVFVLDASGTVTMGSSNGTGTVATTAGSPVVNGTGTAFLTQVHSGDVINITGETAKTVVRVVSNLQLWTSANMATTGSGKTYTVPTLSASSVGFRGAAGRQIAGDAGADTDYRTSATDATNAQKGEGFAGTPRYLFDNTATPNNTGVEGYPNGSSARGAPGNAGGGGTDGNPAANDQNTGGGGGANGGAGGGGGNAWSSADAEGGFGGIFPFPSTTRVVAGGGGGAGTTNNGTSSLPAGVPAMPTGIASSGAAGGGIVIIRANALTGTGTISANGGWPMDVLNDAGGGGGAGGTVIINTRFGTLTSLTVQARGGRGGNAWLVQGNPAPPADYPGERHGPGGGGGGGAIYLSSTAASTDVTGGANGLTTTTLDNFGANPGQPGVTSTPLSVMSGVGASYGCAIADLAVTNTDNPDPVTPGSNITYTQTVTNNGPNAADQPVFTTSVPASATFVSLTPPAGWTCITPAVGAQGLITCTVATGTLASGASAVFPLVVQAHPGTPAGYIISNTANITSQTRDSNSSNDSATTTTAVTKTGFADLSVVISDSPDPVLANNNITYTQTMTNGGASTAANPTFTETIPANTTFQGITPPAGWTCITPVIGGTGTITCTAASMVSGATLNFPLTVKVNAGTAAGTVITETATVSSTTPDANTSNNTSTATTTVRATGTADLAVTVVASPDPVSPGSLVTFTETVTNNGPSTSSTVSFTQQTPVGTTFESITPPAGWTCGTVPPFGGTGTITCTRASFPNGTVSTFAPVFRVNGTTATGSTITLPGAGATVSAATTDPVAANNSANDSVLVAAPTSADLAITKSDSPDPVGQGQLVTYTLRVTNNGPAVATNVVVTDNLPATAPVQSFSTSQGSCSGTTTITCSLGSLNVGAVATINIVVQAQTTGTITNNCSVTGAQTDPVAANNSASQSTTVLAVTLARLRKFETERVGRDVQILWQTDFESRTLGFNVYRDVDGTRTKINPGLIAGSALVSRRDARSDYVYRFTDRSAPSSAQYWVEDIELSGLTMMHGPITASDASDLLFRAENDSITLDALDDDGNVFASPAGYGVVSSLEPTWNETQLAQQYELAGVNALKIYVSQEGWQRVTRAAIVAAGFDPGTDASRLSLFTIGSECAIVVNQGGNGQFDEPTDSIEFYGLPVDTVSTGSRVYWLVLDTGDGDRVVVTPAAGGAPLTSSVEFSHQRSERSIWFPTATSNGEGQNFFGPIVTTAPSTQDLTLGNVDTGFGGNASLTVALQGGTEVPHSVELSMNGHVVGIASYANLEQPTFTYDFPQSWLTSGTNTLSMRSLGGDDDVSGVAYTRVDYHHLLQSDGGAFFAELPAGQLVTVSGFAAGIVRAIDVTDATQPSEIETDVDGSGNASFTPVGSGTRSVLVFHESRVVTPDTMLVNQPSTWNATKATNSADLVIFSHADFLAAASTLAPVREAEGIETSVIDVEDVYDEYNFGIRDPRAIRAFLQDSMTWSKAPHYALLVGDASIDPRNYLAEGSYDFLPTKLVATTQLKTASDDWMADFNDDGIAELAVGRIPSRTLADATRIFNRLATRGTPSGAWSNRALFVTDATSDYDFSAVTSSLELLLPPSMTRERIDLGSTPSPSAQIVSSMNDGQLLVNYIGHGSTEIWSGNAFDTTTALTLENGSQLPFAVIMNCLNGYFHDLFTYSLGEGLLNAPDGGAIAVWASSSLTQPDQQAIMNRELYRQLFYSSLPIGEAVRRAKIATTDMDVRKSWNLLGDPSMQLVANDDSTPVTQSTVAATPNTIVANGSATSTIVVQQKDDNGANVMTGGATVTLSTTSGTLSSVVDNNNGTYTATLTAPTTAGTATISGTLNGLPLANSELVELSPGSAVAFEISAPATVVAGEPFTVIVKARDAHGNIAIDYEGQLHFTASDAAAQLPADHALQPADDGVYTFVDVVLHTKGTRTITVRDASNGSILGTASIGVMPAETSTFVTSSPNPSTPGETVTLTANVTASSAETITGVVTFRDGATTLGSASLSGASASIAIASLSSGSHSITASYGGDETFAPSTSESHTHTVMAVEIGIPVVSANATSGTSVSITWSAASGATGYDIFRSTANGSYSLVGQSGSTAFVDGTVSANTSYLYKVRGRDGGGSLGTLSAAEVATTVVFTDDPILAGITPLKAIHITQLRTAVNALRAFAGLSAASFTDPSLTGAAVKTVHITELRSALDAARAALALAPIAYSDPTLTVGSTRVKRAHVMELRDGVR